MELAESLCEDSKFRRPWALRRLPSREGTFGLVLHSGWRKVSLFYLIQNLPGPASNSSSIP